MPFVAYLGAERVLAFDLDTAAWSALRGAPENSRLTLVCGVRAIAKTSKLGTQFFAHHNKAGCTLEHLEETQQHLAMKRAVAEHINSLPGWDAVLEYANEDRSWVADVMAIHTDGRRAAFEIQLSHQSSERWEERSQQYFDVGIMPVWVTPLRHYFEGIDIPVLRVPFRKSSPLPEASAILMELPATSWLDDQSTLGESIATVLFSRPPWTMGTPSAQHAARSAERQQLELEELRRSTANGRFEERVERNNASARAPFHLHHPVVVHSTDEMPFFAWASVTRCWKCTRSMLLWFASNLNKLEVPTQARTKRFENHPEVHRAINAWLQYSNPHLPKAKLKPLPLSDGAAPCCFVCPHCDSVQGQGYVAMLQPEKWSRIVVPTGFDPGAA